MREFRLLTPSGPITRVSLTAREAKKSRFRPSIPRTDASATPHYLVCRRGGDFGGEKRHKKYQNFENGTGCLYKFTLPLHRILSLPLAFPVKLCPIPFNSSLSKSLVADTCWAMSHRPRKKGLYVVGSKYFLLLLKTSAWPCLGPA